MLISKDQGEWVEIPHEPGQKFQLRSLTWVEKGEASEVRQASAMAKAAALPPAMFEMLEGMDREQTTEQQFDMKTVLWAGVLGWTYEADLTPETLATLDDETAEWAFGEIIGRSQFSRAEGNGSTPDSTPGPSDTSPDGP